MHVVYNVVFSLSFLHNNRERVTSYSVSSHSVFIDIYQAHTQDFEKGGSDYQVRGSVLEGNVPPPHEAQNVTLWMI